MEARYERWRFIRLDICRVTQVSASYLCFGNVTPILGFLKSFFTPLFSASSLPLKKWRQYFSLFQNLTACIATSQTHNFAMPVVLRKAYTQYILLFHHPCNRHNLIAGRNLCLDPLILISWKRNRILQPEKGTICLSVFCRTFPKLSQVQVYGDTRWSREPKRERQNVKTESAKIGGGWHDPRSGAPWL